MITADVFRASQQLREYETFMREDGTPLQYTLVNIRDWCKNEYEVVNQLRMNTENSHHRYDVILLINGLPVVQIELKTLHVNPRRAMEQIVEYKHDPGNGYSNSLLCFMQLFIVSNRSQTYYFANNHAKHFAFNADERFLPIYQLAGEDNQKIAHLHDFADQFLPKCTLGQLISRYMVLVACEQKMMIMRPYQVYAVKAIVDCIHQNRGNGYIWHTTGSGKTLTSFKASTLLKSNPDVDKCLFVVDRKDLDRQTREEFNKFQEGCVEENTNTETLVRRLLSEDYADKVIVTTIQKLGLALDENSKRNQAAQAKGRSTYKERLESLRDKRMVFIFDECHRSQFGDNHKAIKSFFPKSQLFGFTGTPIFDANATYKKIDGTVGSFKTTADIFQQDLHNYTITNAIDDRNVLRFHIDYFKPEEESATVTKRMVVKSILDKHDASTSQRRFNAVLATASINDAIEYVELFKTVQVALAAEDPDFIPLHIACVFSPPADGSSDVKQLQEDLPQEKADNKVEPNKKKAALEQILTDYNAQYGTSHHINDFDRYYQDVQQRIKDQKYSNKDYAYEHKIDVTIVVDMLLTGFDSKFLNTLYVDKNLKHHGLIQAFSRTNRILNGTKPYGNILDFRQQEEAVDEAITLFSGSDPNQAREIWLVDPAPKVIKKLDVALMEFKEFMDTQGLDCTPDAVSNLKGDSAKVEFINRFKEVQRLKTQLDQYTDLDEQQRETIAELLPDEQQRGFRGVYLETAQQLKAQQEQESMGIREEQGSYGVDRETLENLDFELVLFSSVIIDYDYIIGLVAQYSQNAPTKRSMTRAQIISVLSAESSLMEQRDDLIEYINTLQAGGGLTLDEIRAGFDEFKAEKYGNAINAIAQTHKLEPDELRGFVDTIIQRMIFDGEQLSDLMEPLELGWKDRTRAELALMDDLVPLLKKWAEGREISGLNAYE